MLRSRDKHLLPADPEVVAFAKGGRFDLRCVGAGGRLGDGEGLKPEASVRDLGKVRLTLRGASVPKQRTHHVHLRMADGPVST